MPRQIAQDTDPPINDSTAVHDPAKRWRLVNAAAAAFSRRGFERAGVDEIAAAADVAKGTVYLYFRDKADLFVAVLNELDSRLQLRTFDGDDAAPETVLRGLVRNQLEVADEAPDLFRCYVSALFGVNRDFQAAALAIFESRREHVVRALQRMHGRTRRTRQIERRASVFLASILAAALVAGLEEGSAAERDEEALMAIVIGPLM